MKSLAVVVCTLSLFPRQRNAFEIHLPRKVLPLLQTSGLKQGRLLGLVEKAKSHAAALDTSAMPLSVNSEGVILSVLHAVRPALTRKVPVLLTIKSACEPEENLSQVLIFYPTFTLKDSSTWSFMCVEEGISLRETLTIQILSTHVIWGRAKRRWLFRSLTTIKTSAMTGV